jgi:hypothetical protein
MMVSDKSGVKPSPEPGAPGSTAPSPDAVQGDENSREVIAQMQAQMQQQSGLIAKLIRAQEKMAEGAALPKDPPKTKDPAELTQAVEELRQQQRQIAERDARQRSIAKIQSTEAALRSLGIEQPGVLVSGILADLGANVEVIETDRGYSVVFKEGENTIDLQSYIKGTLSQTDKLRPFLPGKRTPRTGDTPLGSVRQPVANAVQPGSNGAYSGAELREAKNR